MPAKTQKAQIRLAEGRMKQDEKREATGEVWADPDQLTAELRAAEDEHVEQS